MVIVDILAFLSYIVVIFYFPLILILQKLIKLFKTTFCQPKVYDIDENRG